MGTPGGQASCSVRPLCPTCHGAPRLQPSSKGSFQQLGRERAEDMKGQRAAVHHTKTIFLCMTGSLHLCMVLLGLAEACPVHHRNLGPAGWLSPPPESPPCPSTCGRSECCAVCEAQAEAMQWPCRGLSGLVLTAVQAPLPLRAATVGRDSLFQHLLQHLLMSPRHKGADPSNQCPGPTSLKGRGSQGWGLWGP